MPAMPDRSTPQLSHAGAPKLLDRLRTAIRLRHFSRRTEEAYVGWVRRYILFHRKRHPSEMAEADVTTFLIHLASGARRLRVDAEPGALCVALFVPACVRARAWRSGWVGMGEAFVPCAGRADARGGRARARPVVWFVVADRGPALWGRVTAYRVSGATSEGYGHARSADSGAQWQGPERSAHHAASVHPGAARATSSCRSAPACTGCARRCWTCLAARRAGCEISAGGGRVAVAVRFSGRAALPRSTVGPSFEISPTRVRGAARRDGGRPAGRPDQARDLSHVPAFVCDPSTGGRIGHSNGAGASGSSRCEHDDGVYACAQSGTAWCAESGGSVASGLGWRRGRHAPGFVDLG